MHRVAWLLLILYSFSLPWEHSMDFGEPWGDVARLLALPLLLAGVVMIWQQKSLTRPDRVSWMALAWLLWMCFSCCWSLDSSESFAHVRGLAQKMMAFFVLRELVQSRDELRSILRALVAGGFVLALLTIVGTGAATDAEIVRATAYEQDPNDVAQMLALLLVFASLLFVTEIEVRVRRIILPVQLLFALAVVFTGSRSGLITLVLAFCGALLIRWQHDRKRMWWSICAVPMAAIVAWVAIPSTTWTRFATFLEQMQAGGFNQRAEIWQSGWQAFVQAPLFGHGAGVFVLATNAAQNDTAHNAFLSVAVSGGLIALSLWIAMLAELWVQAKSMAESQRYAWMLMLIVWFVSALVASNEENRLTWFFFALLLQYAQLYRAEVAEQALAA